MVHYLLEQFKILDSWLVPVSVIILHDNLQTGKKDKVWLEVSTPLLRRINYKFEHGVLRIYNSTRIFYESWDATGAVEYMYYLLQKASRLSIDCGLYITIWDRCQLRLKELAVEMSNSTLKMVISRYLQSGQVSKNTLKQLRKLDITDDAPQEIGRICEEALSVDPEAFKEHFEPFDIANAHELQNAMEAGSPTSDNEYISV